MSETRLKILRALKERNKTLSELSRELGLSKPSIYRHLIILKSQGLVRRIKNGNKFIYYALTKSGEKLIDLIISMSISYVFAYLLAMNASREIQKEAGGYTETCYVSYLQVLRLSTRVCTCICTVTDYILFHDQVDKVKNELIVFSDLL